MKQWMMAALLSMPVLVSAAGKDSEKVGDETKALLELQRSGQAASATPRPMTGEVADKTYQRYVESFAHPIPENFPRESTGGSSGGSSGSQKK